ncbi:STAS domain-containing protein [Pseudomaricurvus alkylphenolicus]|jgi:anti-anti-sigma factor|uniref:STAS domain-containing protein n=1 Tax=Pseudomaricurvus alkylphenolicus TaxID=1306991 RepID=UPI001420A6F4|nr:STAS domain-containing protein [Pseudomaricurvus alkylphenolicus]NIB43204.1 STAS domain-containing protein [Pseudomaricurvus alkylphenolicus]
MGIQSHVSDDGKELVISIQGRFDFSAHQDFRNSYETLDSQPTRYKVDMNETTYLDSSALGMLLLLRDHAGGNSAEIEIVNCSPDVKKILTISNFEQLFTIE